MWMRMWMRMRVLRSRREEGGTIQREEEGRRVRGGMAKEEDGGKGSLHAGSGWRQVVEEIMWRARDCRPQKKDAQ